MKRSTQWVPLPLFLLAIGMAFPANAENYAPQIGQRHPEITLPRISDRKPVSLSDFRGRKVLLIHFASW